MWTTSRLTAISVAVGTRISSRAPRTEPYVRLSRIRLPPRVCDGEASARPRMEDDWFREPGVHQLRHLCPRDPIFLASTPQRMPPKVSDVVPEHRQCAAIGRHCMVVEVAADDPSQPLPLLGDRLVHASPHLLFDHLELRPHAGMRFSVHTGVVALICLRHSCHIGEFCASGGTHRLLRRSCFNPG